MEPIIELDLYIIRHGESRLNAGLGTENPTLKDTQDPVLTEKGIAQAVAAGEFLKDISFDAFYASPLLRAARTATEILKKQPEAKPLNVMPEICEVGIVPEYKGVDGDINAVACIGTGVVRVGGMISQVDNINRILDRVALYLA